MRERIAHLTVPWRWLTAPVNATGSYTDAYCQWIILGLGSIQLSAVSSSQGSVLLVWEPLEWTTERRKQLGGTGIFASVLLPCATRACLVSPYLHEILHRIHPQDKIRAIWKAESDVPSNPHGLICNLAADSTVHFSSSSCGLFGHVRVYVCVCLYPYMSADDGRWRMARKSYWETAFIHPEQNHCETGKKGTSNLFGEILYSWAIFTWVGPGGNDRDFLALLHKVGWQWLGPRPGREAFDLIKNRSEGIST